MFERGEREIGWRDGVEDGEKSVLSRFLCVFSNRWRDLEESGESDPMFPMHQTPVCSKQHIFLFFFYFLGIEARGNSTSKMEYVLFSIPSFFHNLLEKKMKV